MHRPVRRLLHRAASRAPGLRPLSSSTAGDKSASGAAAADAGKPRMPLRESLSIDDSAGGGALLSAAIVGTLGLGFYLHRHDYMHRREEVGVFEAAPGPLKPLVGWVQRNVPGAYDTRQGGLVEK